MNNFSKKDIIGSIVIGEAIAWLLFVMVRVNAPDLPLSAPLAERLSSTTTGFGMGVVFPILALLGLYSAHLVASRVRILWQAAKFVLVGALNTFIDLGILNILILISGTAVGTPFLIFKGVAFTIAVTNSYFWNKYWTFDRSGASRGKEFTQFLAVSLGGLIVNVATAGIIVNIIGPQANIAPAVWANIGALGAVVLSLVWNFIGYKFWVFKKN